MNAPVTVVGEALIDIVNSRGRSSEHVGGSPANVAIGLARLGHEARLATHVADDTRGRRIAGALTTEGVTLADGSTTADRTPTAQADLDDAGVATYTFDLEWRMNPGLDVPHGSHLHTGSLAGTIEPGDAEVRTLVERCREFGTISYDPNARPQLMGSAGEVLPKMEHLISLSDVVKASDEDVAWLYGDDADLEDVLARWNDLGARVALITRGGDGAIASVDGEVRRAGLDAVEVVDTVGAGDSFMAGLLSGLLDAGLLGGPDARDRLRAAGQDEIAPAIDRALHCASITVGRAGANPPTRDEI